MFSRLSVLLLLYQCSHCLTTSLGTVMSSVVGLCGTSHSSVIFTSSWNLINYMPNSKPGKYMYCKLINVVLTIIRGTLHLFISSPTPKNVMLFMLYRSWEMVRMLMPGVANQIRRCGPEVVVIIRSRNAIKLKQRYVSCIPQTIWALCRCFVCPVQYWVNCKPNSPTNTNI